MRRNSLLLIAGAVISLAGCTGMGSTTGTSGPPTSKVVIMGSDFDLGVGQSARVDGTPLTIAFDGVPEDSRCPLGVLCIQAGNATAALTVTDGAGAKASVKLYGNPTPTTPDSAKVGGYTVKLVALQPIRRRDVTIAPASYVATLHVDKI